MKHQFFDILNEKVGEDIRKISQKCGGSIDFSIGCLYNPYQITCYKSMNGNDG